jgi:hypothetical protein
MFFVCFPKYFIPPPTTQTTFLYLSFMLPSFLTGLYNACNFIRLVLLTAVCEIATNMISLACRHCRREAHFIGNPLFQLVSPGVGHLSFSQKGVRLALQYEHFRVKQVVIVTGLSFFTSELKLERKFYEVEYVISHFSQYF